MKERESRTEGGKEDEREKGRKGEEKRREKLDRNYA